MIYIIPILLLVALAYFGWYRIYNQHTINGNFSKLKTPLVIFDFDGTICPSYDLFIDELNVLSDSFGHRKIEDGERVYLRDISAKDVLKSLNISSWKLPFLIKKLRFNVQSRILNLTPISGVSDILQDLKSRNISIGILTSNSEENVHAWLKLYNLDIFDFIFTGNNLFGKEKHLKLITKGLSHPSEVYYVGDEMRDMEAARRAHVKGVAVTWGYNSHEGLALSKPDYICDDASSLAVIFQRGQL